MTCPAEVPHVPAFLDWRAMDLLVPLAIVWTLGVMSPGPDFIAILRTAMRHGHRAATSTALGVVTGISVWIVLALVGLTALVQAVPAVGVVMKVAGAVFLIGYGVFILWSLWRARRAARAAPRGPAADEASGVAEQAAAPSPARSITAGAAFRLGDSLILLTQDRAATVDPIRQARGWRYITLQVADIDAVHDELRGKGVREGLAPVTLGEVARISMILDPDGNWIELSRRASIVGSLSDDEAARK